MSPGVLARIREWLFRFGAIERARAHEEPWRREHVRRARAAVDLADASHEPTLVDRAAYSSAACELYRQGVHAALLAVGDERRAFGTPLDALRRAAPELVLDAAGGPEELAELEALVATPSFVESTSSDDPSQSAEKLGRFARSLLRAFERRWPDVSTLRFERALRLFVLTFIVAAIVIAAIARGERFHEQSANLARGRPWRASSEALRCDRRTRTCAEFRELDIFFHTAQEPSPWIEFDLGHEATFSRVIVQNRQDCCQERAIPLVIEVSRDHEHFREVMRQPRSFTLWRAKFSRQEARWVRLRVARTSILHLEDVKVLP